MKQLLLICAVVALVGGCGGEKALTKEESVKVIEAAIRKAAGRPTGELTQTDLEKVTELSFEDNKLTSVKGLEKLTQLEILSLGDNQLTEVPRGLEKLTQLWRLNLEDNQLTSVEGLEKLTQLRSLYLYGNQLTDVKGLEKLTQLERLSLWNNQLTDVKGLEKCTKLTSLNLEWNPDLTKAQIDELKKALPKCEIESNAAK